ncbi:Het-C-domain-containing protein [Mycena crocata]|nr:Het-C-domain-containing protein [Mycena crocata]
MSSTRNFTTTLLIITLVLVLLPETVHAFGAGDIPDFAFLNEKAFRHGDIENILSTLAKTAGHVAAAHAATGGGDLLGFAKSIIKTAVTSGTGNEKFSSSDIKKVYFGNWLRDYSQAMDIGGLSKLTAESLVLVVSVLGFMTFGFATEEFEVTAEKLGVYLPVEHIDNPKGYAEKEGDARQFHPKLRPPVDRRELEIDERTGMKNYMATENQGWDTSTAHIRRVLVECIERGRRAKGRDGPELYEAYRLLGTGLHTLEDLLAHSNWVEIALRKMGHNEVFCHVGEDTAIQTPNGRAPPLVTGTFGGADFLHSLLGEAGDKLSQASVTDLASKMDEAKNSEGDSKLSAIKDLLSQLPIGGGDDKVNEGEQLQAKSKAYNFDPDNIAPPEVQQQLMALLKWRDGLMRSILEKIEMIPGLDELIEQLSNALNAYVYTVIAPWVTPILQQATGVLGEGSKAVIDSDDQYEVFENPRASDPSHSLLSKDHFGLILNEPAGKIAMLVVEHSVKIVVQAWSDHGDPNQAVDAILEAFHHPYYATGQSSIQHAMFQEMEKWLGGLGDDVARETLQALTKESVRNGKNKRLGSENEDFSEPGYGGCGHGAVPARRPQGQSQGGGQGRQQQQQQYGGQQQQQQQQYGGAQSTYSGGNTQSGGGYNTSSSNTGYGSRTGETDEYGSSRRNEGHNTSSGNEYGRSGQTEEYGSSRRNEGGNNASSGGNEYGRASERTETSSHGRSGQTEEYGSSRRNEGEGRHNEGHQGGRHHGNESLNESSGYAPSYGQQEASGRGSSGYGGSGGYSQPSYGGANQSSGYGKSEERTHGGHHGSSGRSEEPSYNSSSAYESSGRGASGGYGRQEESHGRGEERGGGGYGGESTGYGGGEERHGGGHHGGGHQGGGRHGEDRDETFGAERLNLNEERGNRGGHGHGSSRNEYESNY